MKNLFALPLSLPLLLLWQKINAQCIEDIYYLIDNPTPCLFVGTVATSNSACFDPFAYPQWKYTWRINESDDGDLVAVYQGLAFSHQFTKFGGYDFCLEIDKDGQPQTAPDIIECVTYTTCQICGESEVGVKYLDCPILSGCNVEVQANLAASNAVGVLPLADVVVTYLPTPVEQNAGFQSYDITFPNIPVTYHPHTGKIDVSENVSVPYRRGCFKARVEFNFEFGAGAHSAWGGPSCFGFGLQDDEVFRCLACQEENCHSNIKATQMANAQEACGVFFCETGGRSNEEALEEELSVASAPGFSASPNPARDAVHLKFSQPAVNALTIRFFNAYGQVQHEENWAGKIFSRDLNISAWLPGIYYLLVEDGKKTVFSEKILVVR